MHEYDTVVVRTNTFLHRLVPLLARAVPDTSIIVTFSAMNGHYIVSAPRKAYKSKPVRELIGGRG